MILFIKDCVKTFLLSKKNNNKKIIIILLKEKKGPIRGLLNFINILNQLK